MPKVSMAVDEVSLKELFKISFKYENKIKNKKIVLEIRPLTLGDYIEIFDEDGNANVWDVLQRCIISPKLDSEILKTIPIGIAMDIFKVIMNESFLPQTEQS